MLNFSLFPFLVVLLIPFSYVDIAGFRLIILQVFFVFLILVFNGGGTFKANKPDVFAFALMICAVIFFAILNSQYDYIAPLVLFFFCAYWPRFLPEKIFIRKKVYRRLVDAYFFGAIFCGFGVLIQRYFFQNLGIEFGKMDQYLDRTGFGFLWLDYSFLSLYLVSAIPLVYRSFGFSKFVLISIFLVYSSIATTARTGIFALLISVIFYFLIRFFQGVFRSSLKRSDLWILLFFIFMALIMRLLLSSGSDREITTSSSGRWEGYVTALDFVGHNLFFGSEYNALWYKENHGVLPHNMFFYILIMGGGGGFILFIVWFFLLVYYFWSRKNSLDGCGLFSLLIVFIGMQFVPSFFSAYFISVLISLVFCSEKIAKTT